jgi:hypothetical protein
MSSQLSVVRAICLLLSFVDGESTGLSQEQRPGIQVDDELRCRCLNRVAGPRTPWQEMRLHQEDAPQLVACDRRRKVHLQKAQQCKFESGLK